VVCSTFELWCVWRCLHSAKACCSKNIKKKKCLKGTYVYLQFIYKFSGFIFLETHTENFTFCHLIQTGSLIFLVEIEVFENKVPRKVKRSWMEELAGEWRKLLVYTFKPWHSTALFPLQFAVYIKGSIKLKYWVSENFFSQTFMGSILGSDCELK